MREQRRGGGEALGGAGTAGVEQGVGRSSVPTLELRKMLLLEEGVGCAARGSVGEVYIGYWGKFLHEKGGQA